MKNYSFESLPARRFSSGRRGRHSARVLELALAVQAMLAQAAWAQAVPASQPLFGGAPLVEAGGAGADIVHIAPPGAAGVSHNQYERFNVAPAGLIFNNSAQASATALGGQVGGNPQLGAQPARVILNEVTSAAPSALRGALEVAGSRADVIIANPNGISCDGCSFLNTNRATLAAGQPRLDAGGSIRGFDIQSGSLTIGPGGLKAPDLQQLDLLARGLVVEGSVQAERIRAIAGVNYISHGGADGEGVNAHSAATNETDGEAGGGRAPRFAIDIRALGGMHAGQVFLLATEQGVGVNSEGRLEASEGSLSLSSSGDLHVRRAEGRQAVTLTSSAGDVVLTERVHSPGSVEVSAAQALKNMGHLQAERHMALEGATIHNGGTIVGGKVPSAVLSGHSLDESQQAVKLVLKGKVRNQPEALLRSHGSLTIDGTLRNIGGKLHADGDVTIVGEVRNENADFRVARQTSSEARKEVRYTGESTPELSYAFDDIRFDSEQNLVLPSEVYPFEQYGHEAYDENLLTSECVFAASAGGACGAERPVDASALLLRFGLKTPEGQTPEALEERRLVVLGDLKDRVATFNADLKSRQLETYFARTTHRVDTTEDKAVLSRPAEIRAGGNIHVGGGSNDHSVMSAGGSFVSSAGFENYAATGERFAVSHGTVQRFYGHAMQSKHGAPEYEEPIPFTAVEGGQVFALDLHAGTASRHSRQPQAGVARVSARDIRVHGASQAFVNSGALYADGGGDRSNAVIEIHAGSITHSGDMYAQESSLRANEDVVLSGGRIASIGALAPEPEPEFQKPPSQIVSVHAGRHIELGPVMQSIEYAEGGMQAEAHVVGRPSLIEAQDIALKARDDIISEAAILRSGGSINADAGRHFRISTAMEQRRAESAATGAADATGGTTPHWRETTSLAQGSGFTAAGPIQLKAKENLVVAGSSVSGQHLDLQAQSVTIDSVHTDHQFITRSASAQHLRDFDHARQSAHPGTVLAEAGVSIQAVDDVNLTGSRVMAANGPAQLKAGRDLIIQGALTRGKEEISAQAGRSSWLSSTSDRWSRVKSDAQVRRSEVAARELLAEAGRDLSVSASSASSLDELSLRAGRHVTVSAEQQSGHDLHTRQTTTNDGLFAYFAPTVVLGRNSSESNTQSGTWSAEPAIIQSSGGDVTVDAQAAFRQVGSDLLAKGRVDIRAHDIQMTASQEQSQQEKTSHFRTYGLSWAPKTPVVMKHAANAYNQYNFAGYAQGSHAFALYTGAAVVHGVSAARQLGAHVMQAIDRRQWPFGLSDIMDSILRGSAGVVFDDYSEGPKQQSSATVRPSTTRAESQVRLQAHPQEGVICTSGAQLSADKLQLNAGQVDLGAAQVHTTLKDLGYFASVGAASDFRGGGADNGYLAGAYGSSHHQGVKHQTTQVAAKTEAAISAARDIKLQGATVTGEAVTIMSGGALGIETPQDTEDGTSWRVGTLGYVGMGANWPQISSATVSATGGYAYQHYAVSAEPTGILAGVDGFEIQVTGPASLVGALVTSKAGADKNRLSTARLETRDIPNFSRHGNYFGETGIEYAAAPAGGITLSAVPALLDASAAQNITRSTISPAFIQAASAQAASFAATGGVHAGAEHKTLVRPFDISQVLARQASTQMAAQSFRSAAGGAWSGLMNWGERQSQDAEHTATSVLGIPLGFWREGGYAVIDMLAGRWWR